MDVGRVHGWNHLQHGEGELEGRVKARIPGHVGQTKTGQRRRSAMGLGAAEVGRSAISADNNDDFREQTNAPTFDLFFFFFLQAILQYLAQEFQGLKESGFC